MRPWLIRGLVVMAALAVAIQLVPYGRDHTNPAVVVEPEWDSPVTRELVVGACFDCHSNETVWPWYSRVAPFSWAIQSEVEEGRDELNFSEWHLDQEGGESAETVREGSMPPGQYQLLHSEARLDDNQVAALEAGLVATFGDDEGSEEVPGSRSDDDSSGG